MTTTLYGKFSHLRSAIANVISFIHHGDDIRAALPRVIPLAYEVDQLWRCLRATTERLQQLENEVRNSRNTITCMPVSSEGEAQRGKEK